MTVNTLYGGYPGPARSPNTNPVEYKEDMRERVCTAWGVDQLPVERFFSMGTWGAPPPGPSIVSFDQDPDDVTAGLVDGNIAQYVGNLNPLIKIWLCLNHEPENNGPGPMAQSAAFAHFADVVYANRPSTKIKVAPILMSWTIGHGDWQAWLPAVDRYDALGFDAYWLGVPPWNTPEGVFGPAIAAAASLEKRLLIPEHSMGAQGHGGFTKQGSSYIPIPEQTWTDWYAQAVPYLDDQEVRAVCQFETNKLLIDGDWRISNHPSAQAIYAAAVQDTVDV